MARKNKRAQIRESADRAATIEGITAATMPGREVRDSPLIVAKNGIISIGGYDITSHGLVVNESNYDDWCKVLNTVCNVHDRTQVILGDVLVEAERQYGITYQQVAEETGYAVQSLHTFKSVMERVEFWTRIQSSNSQWLKFAHFRVVANKLDDSEIIADWLTKAADEEWSAKHLAREIDRPTLPDKPAPVQLSMFDILDKIPGEITALKKELRTMQSGDTSAWNRASATVRGRCDRMIEILQRIKKETGD